MSGWTDALRYLLDSPAWCEATPAQRVLAVVCLAKARTRPASFCVGGVRVDLAVGQFFSSQEALSEAVGCSRQELRTAMAALVELNYLTNDSTNRGSKITIVDWHTYESAQPDNNQRSNQPSTSHQPAEVGTVLALNSNAKTKRREEKKEKSPEIDLWDFTEIFPTWKKAYPNINVEQEAERCKSWWMSNPSKVRGRKNPKGTVSSWLSRESKRAESSRAALNPPEATLALTGEQSAASERYGEEDREQEYISRPLAVAPGVEGGHRRETSQDRGGLRQED